MAQGTSPRCTEALTLVVAVWVILKSKSVGELILLFLYYQMGYASPTILFLITCNSHES